MYDPGQVLGHLFRAVDFVCCGHSVLVFTPTVSVRFPYGDLKTGVRLASGTGGHALLGPLERAY